MGSRASVSVGIAVALIILGIALPVAYGHWFATRTFVALDTPISFSRGHIRTNDFYINLKEQYSVEVRVDSHFPYNPDCRLGGSKSALETHVTLFHNGQLLREIGGLDYFSSFDVNEKGLYRLDIDVLSDASCLNAFHPRIVVQTWSRFYSDLYEGIGWFSIVPLVGGLGLLVRVIFFGVWKLLKPADRDVVVEQPGPKYRAWQSRFRPARRFSALPTYGLICATFFSFLLMVFMLDRANRPVSRGIWVSVQQHPSETNDFVPATPLIVRLGFSGPGLPPRLYLNSNLVPPEKFESSLKDGLKRRPDWVVFVDADTEVPWAEVVNAMDTVQELHARVVLLSSGTAKESAEGRKHQPRQ